MLSNWICNCHSITGFSLSINSQPFPYACSFAFSVTFSNGVFLYVFCRLVLASAAFHSMDKTCHHCKCKLHTFYNISDLKNNCLCQIPLFMIVSFRICFCKPMGNMRTKNVSVVKSMDLNQGRGHAIYCTNRSKFYNAHDNLLYIHKKGQNKHISLLGA